MNGLVSKNGRDDNTYRDKADAEEKKGVLRKMSDDDFRECE